MKDSESDETWKEAWVELNANLLSTFKVDKNINVPGQCIHICECAVHKPENSPLILGIQDETNQIFLKFTSETEIKSWMSKIKAAKIDYWKKEAKNEGGLNFNQIQNENNMQTLRKRFNTGFSSHQSFTPPLRYFEDIIESGYLIKHENGKESKINNTYFFILRKNKKLYYFHNEYCENVVGELDILDIMIRSNQSDDSFCFDLVSKVEAIFLEANDIVDFRSWQRALLSVRSKQNHHSTDESSIQTNLNVQQTQNIKTSFEGILTSFGRDKNTYLFLLNGIILSWYLQDDNEKKTIIGSINIENCTFRDFYNEDQQNEQQNGFQICSPNQKDLLLMAESSNEKKSWLNHLKKAKLQYWQSPILSLDQNIFDNRGFLWKINGKKRLRRWFVLNDKYFLFFKTSKDSSPEGEICLDNAKIFSIESKETNFRFEIHSNSNENSKNISQLTLDAANIQARDRWLDVLFNARLVLNKKSTTQIPNDAVSFN